MAKLTADLVKARMDELLKNLQPFVKEHDDLVERKVELERIQSDLDTELKKDSQLFDESEAKRERDTAVEIARIQEKFLKQHQARVKVIEKNSTCDYNATRAHLQEVAEEIERNDLRRDEIEQRIQFDDELRILGGKEKSPRVKAEPEESNNKASPVSEDVRASHRPSEGPQGKLTSSATVPLEVLATAAPADGIEEDEASEDDDPDKYETGSKEGNAAASDVDRVQTQSLSDMFSTVVKVDGQWRELHCFVCKANAMSNGKLFKGVNGVLPHIVKAHSETLELKAPKKERVQWCCEIKGRVFSAEDVELMLSGQNPASGAVVVVQMKPAVENNESKPVRKTADQVVRGPSGHTWLRPGLRKAAAAVEPPSLSKAEDPAPRNRAQKTPKARISDADHASKIPVPSPPTTRAVTPNMSGNHRTRSHMTPEPKPQVNRRSGIGGHGTGRKAAGKLVALQKDRPGTLSRECEKHAVPPRKSTRK